MPAFERSDSEIAHILQEIVGGSARVIPYDATGFHRSFRILAVHEDRQVDRIDFDARDYKAFPNADPASWKPHLAKRYRPRFETVTGAPTAG
jgi:hypothetical protein